VKDLVYFYIDSLCTKMSARLVIQLIDSRLEATLAAERAATFRDLDKGM